MTRKNQKLVVPSSDPAAEQRESDEAVDAHRLKQEEEQHYRDIFGAGKSNLFMF